MIPLPKLRLCVMSVLVLVLLSLVGCASKPRSQTEREHSSLSKPKPQSARKRAQARAQARRLAQANPELPPEQRVLPGAAKSVASEAQARARYAQALALVDQTSVLIPGWAEAATPLEQARSAMQTQAWDGAILHGDEAAARAEAALSDHYARLANEELRKAYDYTGLRDAQLQEIRGAEEILVTGNSRLAYGRLRQFNDRVSKSIKRYVVEPGDSLWVIASQPEVYANPWLWPLIWQSNLAVLPNPNRVRAGQVLKLRPHPQVDEVVNAIEHSRGEIKRDRATPRIGEIREGR